MKMKLSPGASIALGVGALVILYLIVKKSGAAAAPGAQAALPSDTYMSITPGSPITGAGLTVQASPPLIPLTLQLN